ncbi:MAG: carboxypeptidase-like regulatory domain-containing protein, partial [Wenzhouxiangellaceae bacterium]|nr:carboxypeptidase-like regulatory domain-containing protein [Wenzhouxiangellaceae bacterium]
MFQIHHLSGTRLAATSMLLLMLSPLSTFAAIISGTVTEAASGTPIAGIEVCSIEDANNHLHTCVFSGPAGEYTISGLPDTGLIRMLAAETASFPSQQWPGINFGEPGEGQSIDLAAGDRSDINFALVPGFRITGQVTGAGGSTVDSFGAQFVRVIDQGFWFFGGGSSPDGTFSSNTMVAGDYKFLITTHGTVDNPDRFVDQLFGGGPCVDAQCDLVNEGTPIALVDADVNVGTVELQPGFVVRGTLTEAATGSPVPDDSVFVQVFDDTASLVTSGGPIGGAYATSAMPDGSYRVLMNANSAGGPFVNQLYNGNNCGLNCDVLAGDPVVLAGADFILDAVMIEGGTITGQVTSLETGLAIEGWVHILSTQGEFLRTEPIAPDGTYAIAGLDPGDYLVFFQSGGSSAAYLDQLHNGVTCPDFGCDVPALGTPVSVTAGQEITVSAQLQRGALLTGTVAGAGGEVITDAHLNLWDTLGNFVAGRSVDASGQYVFPAILPGTYRLAVTPHGVDGNFLPQLFDGIDCLAFCPPDQGSDLVLDGGERVVDFVLNPGFRLSGNVFDENDSAIAITEGSVDLYDAQGNSLAGFGLDSSGAWTSSALPAGSYKLVFNPSGQFASYQREIFDDIKCEGFCDVQNLGTVIELIDQDVVVDAGLKRQ